MLNQPTWTERFGRPIDPDIVDPDDRPIALEIDHDDVAARRGVADLRER